jgi:hypothetical protein
MCLHGITIAAYVGQDLHMRPANKDHVSHVNISTPLGLGVGHCPFVMIAGAEAGALAVLGLNLVLVNDKTVR